MTSQVVVNDDAMDVDEDSTEEDRSGASVNIELEYHMVIGSSKHVKRSMIADINTEHPSY
jgi:hypothetical protein